VIVLAKDRFIRQTSPIPYFTCRSHFSVIDIQAHLKVCLIKYTCYRLLYQFSAIVTVEQGYANAKIRLVNSGNVPWRHSHHNMSGRSCRCTCTTFRCSKTRAAFRMLSRSNYYRHAMTDILAGVQKPVQYDGQNDAHDYSVQDIVAGIADAARVQDDNASGNQAPPLLPDPPPTRSHVR